MTPSHTYLTSALLSTAREGTLELVYRVEQIMGMLNESPKQLPTGQVRTASVDRALEGWLIFSWSAIDSLSFLGYTVHTLWLLKF